MPDEKLPQKYGSRLMALHLHDNGGERGMHSMPFDGTIDWRKTMSSVRMTGYSGAIALEIMNWGYEALLPFEFLDMAYNHGVELSNL